jgi:2-polyprenyl-3-methyl-5-hydroxy-6-metoxy-1,4-benzoquinol methylase
VSFLALVASCKSESPKRDNPGNGPSPEVRVADAATTMPLGSAAPASQLERDQEEYVADVMAFTNTTHDQVRTRMQRGSVPLKEEWEAWEKQGPMTDERMKAFYKQTTNYMYELAEWHLWVPGKRESDEQIVKDIKALAPKNVLDFGGGVGLNSLMIAREGIEVTLADLDSTSLTFAQFRAKRHDIPLKIWKTDLEAAPPDKKYDVILALDVLEHLPREVMRDLVDKLVKVKHPKTKVIMSAPFGRTSVHPMHLDADEHTKQQVARLMHELPPS